MNTLIELFFRRFLVRLIGVNIRFYFFKLIGKPKTKKYLEGYYKNSDGISQDFFNAVIGVLVLIPLSVLVAYLVYS